MTIKDIITNKLFPNFESIYSRYIPPMPETEWISRKAFLAEQREIVRRVERLFALADSIEARYKKAFARVEKIEQSVLGREMREEAGRKTV